MAFIGSLYVNETVDVADLKASPAELPSLFGRCFFKRERGREERERGFIQLNGMSYQQANYFVFIESSRFRMNKPDVLISKNLSSKHCLSWFFFLSKKKEFVNHLSNFILFFCRAAGSSPTKPWSNEVSQTPSCMFFKILDYLKLV